MKSEAQTEKRIEKSNLPHTTQKLTQNESQTKMLAKTIKILGENIQVNSCDFF